MLVAGARDINTGLGEAMEPNDNSSDHAEGLKQAVRKPKRLKFLLLGVVAAVLASGAGL